MDRGLKERLVGAAVLVALAVIFIPMLLDDAPSPYEPITETNIPPRPIDDEQFSSRIVPMDPEPEARPADIEPLTVEPAEPEQLAEQEPAMAPEQPEPETAAETPPADQPSEPVVEQTPEPELPAPAESTPAPATETAAVPAWVIQLGSFSKQENAETLEKKLREAGYPAFIEPLQQDGKKSYRVRVGPEVMRTEADKLRDQINKRFELNGIVVSYP